MIGDPIEFHCRASVEEPPSIGACLVTGITPQDTAEGLEESSFIESVLEVLSVPGTTSTGWNSIGYDDEIVRFAAWRNLLPPYEREFKRDNARFDLLAAFRFAWATGRRDGIEWPTYEDGAVSLSLGDLAVANGVEDHAAAAHDALADVRATIELARILRNAQPKLWNYAFGLRRKREVAKVVDKDASPFLLCDRGIGASPSLEIDRILNASIVSNRISPGCRSGGSAPTSFRWSPLRRCWTPPAKAGRASTSIRHWSSPG